MIGSGLPPLTLSRVAKAASIQPAKSRQKPLRAVAGPSKVIKKSRKLATTPRSRIKSALRQVWLRSRERAACLKAAGHKCERCGVKASVAKGREVKVQVHHRDGINWDGIVNSIIKAMLPDPARLESVCELCHKAEHGGLGGGKAGKGRSKR